MSGFPGKFAPFRMGADGGRVPTRAAGARGPLFGSVALLLVPLLAAALSGQEVGVDYDPAPAGRQLLTGSLGLSMRVLVDSASLAGQELAVVDMTLPPGKVALGAEHRHGAIELFYILEGELEHVVDGTPHRLGPGEIGVLRTGGRVRHRVVSAEPVRALVIWVPGTELDHFRGAMSHRVLPEARGVARDAAALSRLREAWTASYEDGDTDALRDLYTEDAVRMPYDQRAQVGADAILRGYAESFGRRSTAPRLELTPVELHITPTLAVERGDYHEELGPPGGGSRVSEDGTYVALVRRDEEGRWRYEWSIFNRDAPPPRQ